MYTVLLAVFGLVLYIERNDNECPSLFSSRAECVDGSGMPMRGAKPNTDDSCSTLIDKINIAAGIEYRSIKWRRAFTQSVIIMFFIWMLVITPGMLPEWFAFYTTVIIGFAILYFCLNFYSYHLFKTGEDYTKEATALLTKNCLT